MALAWPRVTCRLYIIPLFQRSPSGLPKPVYERRDGDGSKEWNNHSGYAIVWTHKSPNWSVQLSGDLSAHSAHGETPPPLEGGKTHADAIYTGTKSNQKRTEKNEDTKYNETTKLRPGHLYLHSQTRYLYSHGRSRCSPWNSSARSRAVPRCSAGSQIVLMLL